MWVRAGFNSLLGEVLSVAIKYHPTAMMNPTGVAVDIIPLTLSGGDIDLTDPEGPTGGYCGRALLIGSTAGNVKFKPAITDPTARTQAVAANQQIDGGVQYVYSTSNGTSAATVSVML